MSSRDIDVEYDADKAKDATNAFAVTALLSQVLVIILFWTTTTYADSVAQINKATAGLPTDVSQYYVFYSHIAFMVWIGFGFLMTFLRRYSFSAVALNMLFSCFAFEWGLLVMAWSSGEKGSTGLTELTLPWLIQGCFAAATVMISFGALLGKVSPAQMLWVTALEIPFYALNHHFCSRELGAVDRGGSMLIHTFGAYFGLACSWVMTAPRPKDKDGKVIPHPMNGSRTTSDLTAMIGTLFLWLLWPSFNAGLAPAGAQFRSIINTVLALNGSCVSAFVFSRLFSHDGKFSMTHIQFATLAGGVAVGASTDLVIGPGSSIVLGVIAGFVSTWGFAYLRPYLARKINLDDTCGVHNLHGMPGVLGALAAAVSINAATADQYGVAYSQIFVENRTPESQANYQVAALVVTVVISMVSGAFTGKFVKALTAWLPGIQNHGEAVGNYPAGHFEDEPYWETPSDYTKC